MLITPVVLPEIIKTIRQTIADNAEEVTALDQAIGDGDHVVNLQRGFRALMEQVETIEKEVDWAVAFQKIGMTLMSTVGGASGSLYGTLFISMSKSASGQIVSLATFAQVFMQGIEAMKQRGKSDVGEKTMLDVLIPVAVQLQTSVNNQEPISDLLPALEHVALAGMESTKYMLATKGRASFLGDRSRNHIDAGAKTAQLMISSVISVIKLRLVASN